MLNNIKSKLVLKNIFTIISIKKGLSMMKFNKSLQKRLGKSVTDYKDNIFGIYIEILLDNKDSNDNRKFINYEYDDNIRIFFDKKSERIKRNFLTKDDKVKNISIKIESKKLSLNGLFADCNFMKEIYFKKFNMLLGKDMKNLFFGCNNLKKIKFLNFSTSGVENMENIFAGCTSLEEIDLSKFDTKEVVII